jgi:hypothetical protein
MEQHSHHAGNGSVTCMNPTMNPNPTMNMDAVMAEMPSNVNLLVIHLLRVFSLANSCIHSIQGYSCHECGECPDEVPTGVAAKDVQLGHWGSSLKTLTLTQACQRSLEAQHDQPLAKLPIVVDMCYTLPSCHSHSYAQRHCSPFLTRCARCLNCCSLESGCTWTGQQ